MKLKVFWVLLLSLVVAAAPAWAEEIPVLNLKTMQGKAEDLDKWVGKGRWVLVMFWSLNCRICEMNKPAINAFAEKHRGKDADVIGVSIDGVDQLPAIRKKLEQAPLSFPNYVADLGLMALNYEIAARESFRGTPTYWFFSPDGELKAVNPGPVRLEALEAYMARFARN